jgi:DNA-binding transcriptional regulator WhiA
VGEPSTLSGDTKDALARAPVEAAHCRAALRDGLLVYGSDALTQRFRTQRPAIARLARGLFEDRRGAGVHKIPGTRLRRAPSYEIELTERAMPRKPTARCDRRMELRAAFLACGSLAAPARGYHLEFVPPTEAAALRLAGVLRAENLEPKLALRKGRRIVYFKNIDAITQVLATIGASGAVFHLEDQRALKETKNRIRRLVNTEAANVDRAMSAAALQRESIALIADAYGLRNLSKPLREVAELRLRYPTETLAELGRRCTPAVKKSTLNGRIAALMRLARGLL